jgi:hypothetical protein
VVGVSVVTTDTILSILLALDCEAALIEGAPKVLVWVDQAHDLVDVSGRVFL